MKVKVIVLACLIAWCVLWGKDTFKTSYFVLNSYKESKASVLSLKKESSSAKKNVDNLYAQVKQIRDGKVDLSDKVAIAQSIEMLEGVTLNSITAERVNSLGESVVIASVTNFTDVSNFTDAVSCMKFDLTSTNLMETVKEIEDLKLVIRSLQVLPIENQIIVDVQIGGAAS